MSSVKYGGSTIGGKSQSGGDLQGVAILDTGTSLITLGRPDFLAFKEAFQKKVTGFSCDEEGIPFCLSVQQRCEHYWDKMEHLEFTLDGETFSIPPWAYAFNLDVPTVPLPVCMVGVSYLSGDAGLTILGDPFLR